MSTILSVFSLIPKNIKKKLKKLLKGDDILYDITFKLSTKYIPALLIVMMVVSGCNQMFRNIDIDCNSSSSNKITSGMYGDNKKTDQELNNYCWNYETFLVIKALEPYMEEEVVYPGISEYKRGKDEVITQKYYKQIWFFLGIFLSVAYVPHCLWKEKGTEKIATIITFTTVPNVPRVKTMVSYLLEMIGCNQRFAIIYLLCKFLATITPIIQWILATFFIGNLFKFYGLNVVLYLIGLGERWPSPAYVLFPTVAKCEDRKYGESGSIEIKAAICQLPLNNVNQWTFFIYWWVLLFVFILNVISLIRLITYIFPLFRIIQYKLYVIKVAKDEVAWARNYEIQGNDGRLITMKCSKFNVINVKLSYGDWLVLYLIKKNLREDTFRDFIRELVLTENQILYINPIQNIISRNINTSSRYQLNSVQIQVGLNDLNRLSLVQTNEQLIKFNQNLENNISPGNGIISAAPITSLTTHNISFPHTDKASLPTNTEICPHPRNVGTTFINTVDSPHQTTTDPCIPTISAAAVACGIEFAKRTLNIRPPVKYERINFDGRKNTKAGIKPMSTVSIDNDYNWSTMDNSNQNPSTSAPSQVIKRTTYDHVPSTHRNQNYEMAKINEEDWEKQQ